MTTFNAGRDIVARNIVGGAQSPQALLFTGKNCVEVLYFIESPNADNLMIHTTDNPVIQTVHGEVTAHVGDWIIRHDGQFIVCKSRGPHGLIEAPIDFALMLARINYTNHRGHRRWRKIIPIRVDHGPNEYHPTKCSLLVAWDMELTPPIEKTFAFASIHAWEDLPDLV